MFVSISQKLMIKKFSDSMIMLRLGKTKEAKEEFYVSKNPIKNLNIGVDNVVISKSLETKNSSKYLIGYLDEIIRSLVLILPKWVDMLKLLKIRINSLCA